ncbi:hypothetical protein EZV62_003503 [Acer yangbiense]|uniref:Uncharacterized protein n=1 Tax=Acer yangbiense TaxID=1000413 RepID=A0A5C7IHI4_9ROSI|nr:hypothetical protein EZV62_003503 [Acer yangbiense]
MNASLYSTNTASPMGMPPPPPVRRPGLERNILLIIHGGAASGVSAKTVRGPFERNILLLVYGRASFWGVRFRGQPGLLQPWKKWGFLFSCLIKGESEPPLVAVSTVSDEQFQSCPAIVSFPAGGLPNTNLRASIQDCEKLEALTDHFHSLDSLTGLDIFQCSSIKSFTGKGFPTNLTSLSVQDHNIYKALVEWGFHKLTSLTFFWIGGCLDAESFPQGRNGNAVALPASLIYLIIERFPKLKYLSDDGF